MKLSLCPPLQLWFLWHGCTKEHTALFFSLLFVSLFSNWPFSVKILLGLKVKGEIFLRICDMFFYFYLITCLFASHTLNWDGACKNSLRKTLLDFSAFNKKASTLKERFFLKIRWNFALVCVQVYKCGNDGKHYLLDKRKKRELGLLTSWTMSSLILCQCCFICLNIYIVILFFPSFR